VIILSFICALISMGCSYGIYSSIPFFVPRVTRRSSVKKGSRVGFVPERTLPLFRMARAYHVKSFTHHQL
jgi:hypothetical protein